MAEQVCQDQKKIVQNLNFQPDEVEPLLLSLSEDEQEHVVNTDR